MRMFKYKQRPADVGVHKYVNNDCVDRQQGWEDKGKEERENDWTDGRTDGRTEGREEQRGMEGDVKERGWKEEQKVTGRR